jgi:integrase
MARGRKNLNGEGSAYYDRSKKLWYAAVPSGHGPDGATLFRKSRGFKTKAEAEKARREALLALDQGIGRDTTIPTVGGYLARWLEVIERSQLEPKTKENYRYAVAVITPRLAALQLDKLTSDHADAFFVALQATGGKRGQGLSPRTTQNVRTVKKRLVAHNVFALSDPIPSKRERVEPWSEAEANRLLDAAAGTRLEALYQVALYLGLRQGELLGLRWEDVDTAAGILRVRQQVQQAQQGPPFIKGLKTANGRRDLELPADLTATLRDHQDRQRFERERGGAGWNVAGLVFPSEAGTPMYARNLITNYKKLLKRADLPDRKFHALRHTAATIMFARGLSVVEVSRILGHANITITADTYVHWIPAQTGRLAGAMAGFRRASGE